MDPADDKTEILGQEEGQGRAGPVNDATELLAGEDASGSAAPSPPDRAAQRVVSTGAAVIGRGQRAEPVDPVPKPRAKWPLLLVLTLSVLTVLLVFSLLAPISEQTPSESAPSVVNAEAGPAAIAAQASSLVQSAVAADDVDELAARLIGLIGPSPADPQLRLLLDEVTRYTDIRWMQSFDRLEVVAALRGDGFELAALERASQQHIDPWLGSADRVAGLSAAAADWAKGDLVAALNGVRTLARQDDPIAGTLFTHYGDVVAEFERIRRGGASLRQQQLFYLGLDPAKDAFFWRNLGAEGVSPADSGEQQALETLTRAGALWIAYQRQGALAGELRHSPSQDSRYRQRAAELVQANRLLAPLVADDPELREGLFPRLLAQELAFQVERMAKLQQYSDLAIWQQRLALLGADSVAVEH